MANIAIAVGSVYGGAQFVAEQIQEELAGLGHSGEVFDTPELSNITDPQFDTILVVTSTTGQGDLPDNILPLFEDLRSQFPLMPEKSYAVIALGDSSYGDTYCGGGKQFDELLAELQLKPAAERLDIDSCETMEPETEAVPWVKTWLVSA